jgi:hypothetical protein
MMALEEFWKIPHGSYITENYPVKSVELKCTGCSTIFAGPRGRTVKKLVKKNDSVFFFV